MRVSPDLSCEIDLWEKGLQRLAGLDEAGRGAWAGPVSAAAVILPVDRNLLERLAGVRDSKQMTARQRARWAGEIQSAALCWGVGLAGHEEVDGLGVLAATRLAMQRALEQLTLAAEHLLIDGLRLPAVEIPQSMLIRGDARSLSIAAASVLAKTARDALMQELDGQQPGYGFGRHKGYGTRAHRAALERLGPCPSHRLSFAPLKALASVQTCIEATVGATPASPLRP